MRSSILLVLLAAQSSAQSPREVTPLERSIEAQSEFIRQHPVDTTDRESLASGAFLALEQAKASKDEVRARFFTLAGMWYRDLLRLDPGDKVAHYSLGVIEWERLYLTFMRKRAGLESNPKQAGPLPDASARTELRRYVAPIDRAIAHLKTALVIDPEYVEAMLQLNLLYRLRADTEDTMEVCQYDIRMADELLERAAEVQARLHN